MTMRVYPDYRDSGVEWLGDMPEHWAVTRLRDVAELINGYPFDSELFDQYQGIPLVRIRDLFTPATEVKWSGDPVPAAEIGDGDILIGMDGDFNVAWWTHGPALLNQRLCCARALSEVTSQRFLFYCLPFPLKALNEVTYATTVKHLSSLDVLKFRLPLPPPHEQRAIASFLDRETERIDGLTEKKRLLIERLEEYRTALITRTVTRGLPPEAARTAGLDPSPGLKASGVEWLGDVPEHWRVMRLKHIAQIRYGLGEPPPEDPEGPPIIRATDVKSGEIQADGLLRVSADAVPRGRNAFLKTGEILVVRSGAYTGDSAIVPPEFEGSVAGYDIVVRVTEGIPKFVAWQLLGGTVLDAQFQLRSMRAAQPHLNADDIGETWITFPPLDEQALLSAYLDDESFRVSAALGQTTKAIERLQEYRTALITAAVTGKIDVRAAAQAPAAAIPA